MNNSIKSYLKKVRFESSLKRCEALNVSELRGKTVPQSGSYHIFKIFTILTLDNVAPLTNPESRM